MEMLNIRAYAYFKPNRSIRDVTIICSLLRVCLMSVFQQVKTSHMMVLQVRVFFLELVAVTNSTNI
jgi:hypothetical protein